MQISKEEHCAFSCLNVPNWLSILHGTNNIKTLFHYTHLNMADIAELQKWAWSICLEGFKNNKTPYRSASDIYSEVPGPNLCRGSDCSQVLCGIRRFLLKMPVQTMIPSTAVSRNMPSILSSSMVGHWTLFSLD